MRKGPKVALLPGLINTPCNRDDWQRRTTQLNLTWRQKLTAMERTNCLSHHLRFVNYDLDQQVSKWPSELQFSKRYLCTYLDGEKLARNGQKTATFYAASFLPHYRRFLFSHLLVFNLWALANFDSNKRYISMKRKCRRNIVLSILENSTSDVLYLILGIPLRGLLSARA